MGQRQEVAILVSISNYTYKSNLKCTNLLDADNQSTFILNNFWDQVKLWGK